MQRVKTFPFVKFFELGILKTHKKGVRIMHLKGWAITMGVGAAAGAVAILMMPRTNPTRRLAAKAANKVEDAAWRLSDRLTNDFEL